MKLEKIIKSSKQIFLKKTKNSKNIKVKISNLKKYIKNSKIRSKIKMSNLKKKIKF